MFSTVLNSRCDDVSITNNKYLDDVRRTRMRRRRRRKNFLKKEAVLQVLLSNSITEIWVRILLSSSL